MQESGAKEFLQEDVVDLLKGNSLKTSMKKMLTQNGSDRIKILFVRLKILLTQYTEGRLSLTELYKKNNEILRKITKPSRGNWEPPKNEMPNNISKLFLLFFCFYYKLIFYYNFSIRIIT